MNEERTQTVAALSVIDYLEREYKKALTAEVNAKHDFKVSYAVEYRKADGTVEERKQIAVEKTEKIYKIFLQAEMERRLTKVKLDDAQLTLSARQSLLSASAKGNFGYANNREIT